MERRLSEQENKALFSAIQSGWKSKINSAPDPFLYNMDGEEYCKFREETLAKFTQLNGLSFFEKVIDLVAEDVSTNEDTVVASKILATMVSTYDSRTIQELRCIIKLAIGSII